MSLPGLGGWEILLLVLIAIILFGPKKIPELAKAVGQAVREFRRASSGMLEEEKREEKAGKVEDYRDLIIEVAKKMDVETRDRELRDVLKDILAKAKKEGIYDEAIKKLEGMK